MGKSTKTLRLLTNEQKDFRDNLRKSGLGYNGPYVLSQAYAKIPVGKYKSKGQRTAKQKVKVLLSRKST
ncbi:hypothetical protein Tco_0238750, partial [Tanacetum coccineum]